MIAIQTKAYPRSGRIKAWVGKQEANTYFGNERGLSQYEQHATAVASWCRKFLSLDAAVEHRIVGGYVEGLQNQMVWIFVSQDTDCFTFRL